MRRKSTNNLQPRQSKFHLLFSSVGDFSAVKLEDGEFVETLQKRRRGVGDLSVLEEL